MFLLSRSQLFRVLVAQPSCVHVAELLFLLIPCAYSPKLQSALKIVVSERRLCKVEKVVSTREGNVRNSCTVCCAKDPECEV